MVVHKNLGIRKLDTHNVKHVEKVRKNLRDVVEKVTENMKNRIGLKEYNKIRRTLPAPVKLSNTFKKRIQIKK